MPDVEEVSKVGQSSTLPPCMNSHCTTVSKFIVTEQKKHPKATGDLTKLMIAITTAVKATSNAVRKAGFHTLYGLAGTSNTTGLV